MYSTVPKIENAPLAELPAYIGCFLYCLVSHVDLNTNVEYNRMISNEDAAFLRNLYYKYNKGLLIRSGSLADKVKSLEDKGLVDKKSRRFYLSILAINAEYTMVPRVLFAEEDDN